MNSDNIDDDHMSWKKECPFLYAFVNTHKLKSTSTTVEWLPGCEEPPGMEYSVHRMILGTHISGQKLNYMILAQVQLPIDRCRLPERRYFYEWETGRLAGGSAKVEVIQEIPHDGEVIRARHMPQDPSVIATKAVSSEVYIFNFRKYPSPTSLSSTSSCNPDLRLRGHNREGYGLSWSNIKNGYLLSGSADAQICVWDINKTPENMSLDAIHTLRIHDGAVNAVSWHPRDEFLFGSVGDDKYLHIWDLRFPMGNKPAQSVFAHQSEVNCLSFNPVNVGVIATGSADKTVKSFDMRKMDKALHTFDCHKDKVLQVGWCPYDEKILASSCLGRRLMIWDLNRIDAGETLQSAFDGPPELLFSHEGHKSGIADFSWNPHINGVLASVDKGKILQIWRMLKNI